MWLRTIVVATCCLVCFASRVDVFDEVAMDDATGQVCTQLAGDIYTPLTGIPLVTNGSANCSWVAVSNSSQFVSGESNTRILLQ